ncbi:hypothetical protein [Aliiroseovarius sp.]|uniref:hypothetical protein n=1 Tax=Aliiroseovarius sp. TaxID=1872442 RepID=UPI003BA85AA8
MELRWIILAIVLLICGAVALEAWLKRGKRRASFAEMQPRGGSGDPEAKTELGMEATDTDLVDEAHKRNQIAEGRNDAITRRRH